MSTPAAPASAARLDWWRQNRFGMFVHWGLYAATEGYWNGVETKGIGEWIQSREKIPLREYATLASRMTLADFDANEWVALARRAGMGHIVVTAKHHEGFAMYDSACSAYNIVKMGPSGRDPLAELAAACARGGLRFCLYYSHCLDFEHPDAYGNNWDYDPDKIVFARYLEEKCKPQLRELLTGYGPVGLLWFDMPKGLSEAQTRELRGFVHALQPACIVGARLGHGLEEYASLGDNELPCGVLTGDWETPATLNDTWGYKRDDRNWESAPEVVESLAELAASGANYLLNVGPTASGRIPEDSVRILTEVGRWMGIHATAIQGTQASPFAAAGDNWLATCKGRRLYFSLRQWNSQLAVAGLHSRVLRARVLASPKRNLVFTQDGERLELRLPAAPPEPWTNVVELELDGPALCAELPTEQPDGSLCLPVTRATPIPGSAPICNATGTCLESEMPEHFRTLTKHGSQVYNWRRTDDRLQWQFRLDRPGRFAVIARTRGRKYQAWQGGPTLRAVVGGSIVEGVLQGEEAVAKPRTRYFPERGSGIGLLTLAPGVLTLELSAPRFTDGVDLALTELILRRSDG